ncbi:hypothetical protein NYO98_00795 [Nocardioides sp. STR2]|uniref:Uncharacterized protein n=1 Tax=Nocardioides pini TaxID=2975053 RepID=A0ABT4C9Z3_9ACTN|nr:hypothetical protein [Nocardioides pini]MCY4724799.1 hypothetical protein [Nocardioides pini]
MTAVHPRIDTDATTSLHRAWWSLLGFFVTFVLAFVVGEGLASALAHPSGGDQPAELWVMVVATVPALVVFALPAVPAVLYARRAVRLGEPRGRTPAVVAVVVAATFVVLNLVSAVGVLLGG